MNDLRKEVEGWEELQKIKDQESRWVESVVDKALTWADSVGFNGSSEWLLEKVRAELECYPDEEFWLSDEEILRICEGNLIPKFTIQQNARVD